MTREEAHQVLDKVIDQAEKMKLWGNISFVLHYQAGKLQQISDEVKWKRTWRNPNPETKPKKQP